MQPRHWIIASGVLIVVTVMQHGEPVLGACKNRTISAVCADEVASAGVENRQTTGLPSAARLKGGSLRRTRDGTIRLGVNGDGSNRTAGGRNPTLPAALTPPAAVSLAGHSVLRASPVVAVVPAAALVRRPDPAVRKAGKVARDNDGKLTLRAGAPRILRACPPAVSRPACSFNGLNAALAAAQPGDVVVLSPGLYPEAAVIAVDRLTLRGEPGAHLHGKAVQGKAALVVKGARVVIDGIECSDIAVRDRNGACIRAEGQDLIVRNVYFHDNEQGILSGPAGGTLLVEHSLFERNGKDGQAHGVYISPSVEIFIFRNNRVLTTVNEGHGVKSRAQKTVIEGNVIASLDGKDSRAIDIPNGGDIVIRGNVLEKGPNSENWQMIGIALEGKLHHISSAVIEHNVFIFDTDRSALTEAIDRLLKIVPPKGVAVLSHLPGPVIFRDNVVVGAKQIGVDVADGANQVFRNRTEAGLPPYPALPEPPAPSGKTTQ